MKPKRPQRISFDDSARELFPMLRKLEVKPRTSQDVCLLCMKEPAGRVQSHIFPDFITKSIFKDPAKRRLVVTNGINLKKIKSSSPKQPYLLCDNCERKLGALERLISFPMVKGLEILRATPDLPHSEFRFQLPAVPPALFHLFVYSMLWRAEVCQLQEFNLLLVKPEHTELLRNILDVCLSTKGELMIKAFQNVCPDQLPLKYQAITFCEEPRREFRVIFGSGFDYNDAHGYRIFVNEINFLFTANNTFEQTAFAHGNEMLAVNAAAWEGYISVVRAPMIELNKRMAER